MPEAEDKSVFQLTKDLHSQARYGLSIVMILEKIDRVITALHCNLFPCYFQSQEEVCDLKHAAPFQNIIPKPYIPFKGEEY